VYLPPHLDVLLAIANRVMQLTALEASTVGNLLCVVRISLPMGVALQEVVRCLVKILFF